MVKVKQLEEKMRLQQPFLVAEVKNGTTNKGAPYLSVLVQDNTGSIDGKFWDVSKEDQELIQPGRIICFTFDVLMYNKNLQLRIVKAEAVNNEEVNLNEYITASQMSEVERRRQLDQLIASIHNPVYTTLVKGMLRKVGDAYFTYPAASKIHHNFLGGLSEHSLSMAVMADEIQRHYPQLDRDLLIAGALVHDVGKTAEMSGPITTEYTLAGKLEGHISIANAWLETVVEETGMQNTEEAILLHHMILSHHGHYEYGSPVLPMLQEAEVLTLIDNMDARLNTLKQAYDATRNGEWTSKLFALDGRAFYKPKNYGGNQ